MLSFIIHIIHDFSTTVEEKKIETNIKRYGEHDKNKKT